MKKSVMIGVFVSAVGAAGLIACASTSSGGGGSGGSGGYGTGGVGVGGGSGGGSSTGGGPGSGGGSSTGGGPGSGGGSSTGGGTGTGGGGNVTLPAGCASGITIQCNPVTNAGCDSSAGQACDLGQDQGGQPAIGCFEPPNTQKLNETCSNGQSGPFCQGTMHCSGETDAGGGTCKKFCCSASDCGGSGTCQAFDAQLGTLGVCM